MKFMCPIEHCNLKRFQRRSQLRDHLIYFHDQIDSNFECSVCKENFSSFKQLAAHEKNQHGEFSCKVCGQNFSEKTYLKIHTQTHLENRPKYECTKCSKCYLYKTNLNAHIRQKHDNQTFSCLFCDSEISTKQKLEEHIRKQHLSNENNEIEINVNDISIESENNSLSENINSDLSDVNSINDFKLEDLDLLDMDILY